MPESIEDLQALFENSSTMNRTPAYGLFSSDDIFVTDDEYARYYNAKLRNAYIWAKEIYEGESFLDWNNTYEQIFYSGIVLDELSGKEDTGEVESLRGSAYFYRAHANFQLLQLFAPPYEQGQNEGKLGIPLKRTVRVDERPSRAPLEECYEFIIEDLKRSIEKLPETSKYKSRPSKYSAHALLSRVYLYMEEYSSALEWGQKALEGPFELLDYHELDSASKYPFPRYNTEVLLHTEFNSYTFVNSDRTLIDTNLLALYGDGDLRYSLYFRDAGYGPIFRGQYTGKAQKFTGLALDEVMLNVAECEIRTGNIDKGLRVLNELLVSRWVEGAFIPYEVDKEDVALRIVLEERRKSLVYRGINWMDLRRLNTDPRFARTLFRTVNDQTYELLPNDPRYVFPIPNNEIHNNELIQNER